jgi:ribonuclease E
VANKAAMAAAMGTPATDAGQEGQRTERRERGERGRRNDRRGEPRAESSAESRDTPRAERQNFSDAPTPEAAAGLEANATISNPAQVASGDQADQQRAPRERRSRDRYGRDRRERGDSTEGSDKSTGAALSTEKSPVNEAQDQQIRAQAAPEFVAPALTADPVLTTAAAVPAPPIQGSPAPVKAPVANTLPKVTSYELPLQDLVQVAQGSGLQWVNSDASKIAQAQAAMAAEIKPAHVPRERPPVVASSEGPLVLVETKRDLRDMNLPFESPAA